MLPGGEVEFLGRLDHQVKIRGFRIELGEIEAALVLHPGVQEAVVLAVPAEGGHGSRRLVAYAATGEDPDAQSGELPAALRDHLAASLPDYMVPAQIVLVDALPRLASGKIDRRSLPDPGRERPVTARRMVAPRNDVEERLAALWRDLLHLDELSVEDGFFELGGDSILGLQMIFRAGREGLLLEPRDLFRHPTLAELASVARTAPDGEAPETVDRGPATGELPLTPVQHWFFEQRRAAPHHFNQTLFFRVAPAPRPELVGRAVAHLLGHHDALRLRLPDGGRRAVIDPPEPSDPPAGGARGAFAHVDLERLGAETLSKVRTAAAASVQASLDLADGPLVRVVLFTAGGGRDARLLVTIHHLAVDGVSWRILLDDLATLYRQLSAGRDPALADKTTSYRHWAELLAERAVAPEAVAALEAWRRIAAPTAPLPVDSESAAGEPLEGTARRLEAVLDRDTSRAVLRDAHRAYGTNTEEILLAAVARALGAWTGGDEIVLDREGHGRDAWLSGVDLSRTVGWFTAIHPLRLPAADGPGAVLKGVKEALRGVSNGPTGPGGPGGGIVYGLLRYLGAEEHRAALAELPARQVLFNYLGRLDRGGAAPGEQPSGESSTSGEGLRFTLADEPPGPAYAPSARRSHLLEIDARVVGERLRLALIYSPERHRPATAEDLLATMERELRELLAHCAARATGLETPDLTPSDVPLAGLDAAALDRLRTGSRGIVDLYPLSPLQEGILFHSVYAPESRVYDMQLACEITGAVDPGAFRRAWQRLVDRHTVLRSSFHWHGLDRPLQAVHRRAEVPFRLEDWRDRPAPEAAARLRRLQDEELARGFDLGEPPLLRLALVRLGETSWRFVWTHHHLPLDGWSLPPLFAEVFRHYRAELAGETVKLEPVRPYRDYIAWVGSRDPAAAEEFWRRSLSGFLEATPLPEARSPDAAPRSAETGDREADQETDRVTTRLGAEATAALRDLGRRCGVTLGTVVQAAWALLLGRHAGTDDVVFGATVSGRPAELDGAERMLGLFINTLPMRVTLPGEESVEAWLRELQANLAEARGYEYASLPAIQGWSEMPPGRPLFETLVVFENYPAGAAVASATEPAEEDSSSGRSQETRRRPTPLRVEVAENVERTNFPLVLQALPGDRLELRLGFRRQRFDRTAVERLMGRLVGLLGAMADAPERRPEELALGSAAERHQLLHEWNDTGAPSLPDSEALVHRAFEHHAARHPDRVAVVATETTLTYGELARRAGTVARRLAALGIGPGAPVGVFAERSADRVALLLGILQAGGCFVPLAVEAPAERLTAVLDEVLPAVIVAGDRIAERLPEHAGVMLRLSEAVTGPVTAAGEARRSPAPSMPVQPEHPAYVIYTSGSTGRPKGVVVSHRSAAQWLSAMAESLVPEDAFLQRASLSFDPAVAETLAALAGGARTVLAPTQAHQDVDELDRLMVDHRVSHAAFPPQVLELLVERGRPAGWLTARRVLVGGETVPPELPARLYEQLGPDAAVLHRYGPTETTIVVLSWQCPRRGPTPNRLPLGHPIPRTEVYVADAALKAVPPGIAGELLIGGVYLARGYLHRPATTAARFVPDPFSGRPGARLYRTGDLTVRRPDGSLEFLGRVDRQVKIRGFRVELEEIEAILRRHPEVREAVVEMRHEPAGRRLVAYLEVRSEVPVAELRDAAAEALPAYMVPSAWVMLPALPRTPSRKVDRKALPAPAPPERADGAALRAPSTAREKALAAIWKTLLHLAEVGVEDNFFELGGDSILTLQVVSRAARAGLRLTPKQVFESPTIAELATVAERVGGAGDLGPAAGPSVGEIPMTPIQHELLSARRTDRHHFNQAVALRVEPAPRMDLLERALAGLMEHHDLLRARYRDAPDGWHQEIAAADGPDSTGRPPLVHVDLRAVAPETFRDVLGVAAARLQSSLDLERGPLFRVALISAPAQPGTTRCFLLWVAHHLVVDGVSWRILTDDLRELYDGLAQDRETGLPPRTTPFAVWARRLATELAGSPELAAELPRWTGEADGGLGPALDPGSASPGDLPLDCPPESEPGADPASLPNLEGACATVGRLVEAEPTRRLLRDAPSAYRIRPEELLLTALARALRSWTGHDSILLDLESHGREPLFDDVDLSRTVGWFTALYPLRLAVAALGPDDPDAWLKTVKESLRSVPHGGIGYGVLRHLGPPEVRERLAALPRAQVSFNYLGRFGDDGGGTGGAAAAPATDPNPDPNPDLDPARDTPEGIRLAFVGEAPGPAVSPRAERRYLLNVSARIEGERLRISVTYSPRHHRRETVEALVGAMAADLERLVSHCLQPGVHGITPSDFPLADVDGATLERILQDPLLENEEVDDLYPLAPTQQGMLFHRLVDPTSKAYFVQFSQILRGALDTAALRGAWEDAVAAHPILRTAFLWEGLAEPLQVVRRRVASPWRELDWRHMGPEEQRRELDHLAATLREEGFDLGRPPLFSWTLIRLAEEVYVFHWSYHHILLDGWSAPLLRNEIYERYLGRITGQPTRPARRRPFRDFVAWVRRQDMERSREFWVRELAGFRDPVSLGVAPATTAPPTEEERFVGFPLAVAPPAAAALRELAGRLRVTLNTLVQGAWALLLARAGDRHDVVFGATVSGRSAPVEGIDTMLGICISTLPVRAPVGLDQPLGPWLRALQTRQVEAREYEHTPLMLIQKWSEVPSHRPLFESLVVFENYPRDRAFAEDADETGDGRGAAAEIATARDDVDEAAGTSQSPGRSEGGLVAGGRVGQFERVSYPLTLVVDPSGDGMGLGLGVDGRLFGDASGRRLLTTFATLLEGMAERPEALLGELPLLSPGEREQVLRSWSRMDSKLPGTERPGSAAPGDARAPRPVAELIARRAAAAPDATAIVAGEEHVTYGELERRARSWQAVLAARGVGPETRVALLADRTPETIAALLGIWKAGGAYVPIDPATPPARLAELIRDSEAELLVAAGGPGRPSGVDVPSLDLRDRGKTPELAATGTATPPRDRAAAATSRNLAYLIYTSGSTGRPKAVMVEHGSLVDYALAAADLAGIAPGDRVLQFASFAFDTSAEEIFPCLLSGATLVLRDDTVLEPGAFFAACGRWRLTVLDLPTAYWHELTRHLDAEDDPVPPALRLVILGGERAEGERLAAWYRRVGEDVALVNTYGPTEGTIVTTQAPLSRPPAPREIGAQTVWPPVTIGWPRPGARVYVLGPDLEPLAPGFPGELHLGGSGVARGYHARPALTAAAFVPNPFSEQPGDRLYRTGDLVRHREDGSLDFVGRADGQVKLRGHRVELGEVEAVLERLPAVRRAAVTLQRRADRGDGLLAAHVVPAGQAPESADGDGTDGLARELRSALARQLPAFMIPAAFAFLDEMPLTPGGKVDRARLPSIEAAGAPATRAAEPPRNPTEARLVTIWEEVFDRRPLGRQDDFFDLGGDSMLALQLMGRVRRELGRELPLAALFQHTTVAALAAHLGRGEDLGGGPAVAIRASGSRPPLFLVHPAGGEILCYRELARCLGADQPVYGLQAPGLIPGETILDRVEAMAEHYLEAARAIDPDGPRAIGGWSVGGVVAYEMARRQAASGGEPLLLLLDALTPERMHGWSDLELLEEFAKLLGLPAGADAAAAIRDDEETRRRFAVYEATVRSAERFRPKRWDGRGVLVRAVDQAEDHAGKRAAAGSDLGWARYLADLTLEAVPGATHQTLLTPPHVSVLAARLASLMEREVAREKAVTR